MADPRTPVTAPRRRRSGGQGRATTVALGVATAAAVPFAVTGFFRLDLNPPVVFLLCLGIGGGLAAVPRRGPWLALGWLTGCVLYTIAMVVVLWQFGQDLDTIG